MIGILDWQNEHGLENYPLSKEVVGLTNLLVDATFTQFDGFIPVLTQVAVNGTGVTLTITMDEGDVSVVIPSDLSPGAGVIIRGFNRYLGRLTMSKYLSTFLKNYNGKRIFKINTPFLATTVINIPKTAGVYSFAGRTGTVTMGTTTDLSLATSGQKIVFNAVALPEKTLTPLKTINGVSGRNNDITLATSGIFKLTPSTDGLTINLINEQPSEIIPQQRYS